MGFFILCPASSTSTKVAKTSLPFLVVFLLYLLFAFKSAEAYDALDPFGNITIKWDIKSWTDDGYVAMVTMYNFHKYRHIEAPGWKLGWAWKRKEIIWTMQGGQATDQGDCSRFKGATIPHCCKLTPKIVDLLPGAPYNQQVDNCCRGGVLNSWAQDPAKAVSAFQIQVGQAGTSNRTVMLPVNFTLSGPGPGYTCGPAKIVKPTRFLTPDKRRVTQALMTWNVTCLYSQFLAHRIPSCCVSLSAFYSEQIIDCATCICGCQNRETQQGGCVEPNSPHLASALSSVDKSTQTPLLHCTNHMCPIQVHWHVKVNYKDYWRVKITITNFNYRMNYSQWNLVVQHPNFDNITQVFSFNQQSLPLYPSLNNTGMFWGFEFYNDLLMQAGPDGNVQSEVLFGKNKSKFTFDNGWAFPRIIYFNGDSCVMPPADSYPFLPNASTTKAFSLLRLLTTLVLVLVGLSQ